MQDDPTPPRPTLCTSKCFIARYVAVRIAVAFELWLDPTEIGSSDKARPVSSLSQPTRFQRRDQVRQSDPIHLEM